jgi:uncharacterized protein (TIGR03546 family)
MFKYIKSFFMALNANAHPGDIGHAVALGLLVAFVPKANLLWFFLFFLTLFIRCNKGAFFLSFILLSFVVPFADVPVERLGFAILSLPFLEPFYSFLASVPFVGLTRFNNTMVTGGLAAGIILYVPVYFLFRFLTAKYRTVLQPKIVNSKAYKVFLNLPIIKQIVGAGTIAEGFIK